MPTAVAEREETQEKPVAAEWQAPPVQVGDTVYWWPDLTRQRDPSTGIVTKVNQHGRLCISVVMKENMNFNTNNKASVRHYSDPSATKDNTGDYSGCWDVSPQTQERWDLLKRVAALESKPRNAEREERRKVPDIEDPPKSQSRKNNGPPNLG